MEKEKIDYLRECYKIDIDIPDSEIVNGLDSSLGSACFEIKKAKYNLAQAFKHSCQKSKKEKPQTWQDQPTTDGYYWLKDDCGDLKIVQIYWYDNEELYTSISYCGSDCDGILIDTHGKWYGPITPPEED